jgi:hypothetical protein
MYKSVLHSAEAFLVSYSENHGLYVTAVGVEELSCRRMHIMMILIAAASSSCCYHH